MRLRPPTHPVSDLPATRKRRNTSMNWHAIITLHRPDTLTPPTDEQRSTLTRELPGHGIAVGDGAGRLAVDMTVDAATARLACQAAIRAARAAYQQAFGATTEVTAVRVLTEAEHDRELAWPSGLELVGNREAAELLEVRPQRVEQLARQHPDWPAPVARLAAGPVYTRASIEAFGRRWERKPGRPRKAAAAGQDRVSRPRPI